MPRVLNLIAVMARIAALEAHPDVTPAQTIEYAELCTLMWDCRGFGGPLRWRGVWYPWSLFRASASTRHAVTFRGKKYRPKT